MLMSDFERWLEWLCQENAAFCAYWNMNGDRSRGYFQSLLDPFSIDDLQKHTEAWLASNVHSNWRGMGRDIRRSIEQASWAKKKQEAKPCHICDNQRYISVVAPKTLEMVAWGQPSHIICCSVPCGCFLGEPVPYTYQDARKTGILCIPWDMLFNEAQERERDFLEFRGEDKPLPPGFGHFDLVLSRVLFDWILGHWWFKHGKAPEPAQLWPQSHVADKRQWFADGVEEDF